MGEQIHTVEECSRKHEALRGKYENIYTPATTPWNPQKEFTPYLSKRHFVVDFKIGVKQLSPPPLAG